MKTGSIVTSPSSITSGLVSRNSSLNFTSKALAVERRSIESNNEANNTEKQHVVEEELMMKAQMQQQEMLEEENSRLKVQMASLEEEMAILKEEKAKLLAVEEHLSKQILSLADATLKAGAYSLFEHQDFHWSQTRPDSFLTLCYNNSLGFMTQSQMSQKGLWRNCQDEQPLDRVHVSSKSTFSKATHQTQRVFGIFDFIRIRKTIYYHMSFECFSDIDLPPSNCSTR